MAAFGDNLVGEEHRAFEVPFKGEGQMGMKFIPVFFPRGTEGAVISFEAKVTDVVRGAQSWFDARMMTKFIDRKYKDVGNGPNIGGWSGTKDWFSVSKTVQVPSGAPGIALMPTLFNVKAGKMSIRHLSVEPQSKFELSPEEKAAAAERERQAKARFVADEKENRAKWSKMLRVSGNRLVDPEGNEVWLQGVNAGGMESVPNGDQVVKSVVVAIDQWHANCIRLPVKDDFWFGTTAYQGDGGKDYRELIDRIVTLAANRGAYVVLDLHRFRAPKAEHATFWKDAAARYKDHPAVLFELFNEPHGIDWKTLDMEFLRIAIEATAFVLDERFQGLKEEWEANDHGQN
jgi:aryl-phospho-beta-D-glucosidase BglC (GH1 family)